MIQLLFYILPRTKKMTELEKALLNKVEELSKENERLNDLINKLHASCFYYENHRRERKEEDETEECPFI